MKKKKYEKPQLAGQRGYTSFGKEDAKGSDAPDLKEFFQYGQTIEDNDPVGSEYPGNIIVDEVPAFSSTFFRRIVHVNNREELYCRPLPCVVV